MTAALVLELESSETMTPPGHSATEPVIAQNRGNETLTHAGSWPPESVAPRSCSASWRAASFCGTTSWSGRLWWFSSSTRAEKTGVSTAPEYGELELRSPSCSMVR